MNRVLNILKYIALYYGFTRMVNMIIVQFGTVNVRNFDMVNSTSGVFAVLLTLACYRIEKSEVVRNAPTKKSKFKYFILILITLGIILFIYRRQKKGLA